MAAAEGDTQGGWLRAVSREAVKSIQLVRFDQNRRSFISSMSDVEIHFSIRNERMVVGWYGMM